MTQRPTFSSDRGLAGRLALSRLATRVSMVVERGWPLLLPLVIVASLFLSISWLGLFSRLPDMARIGLVAAFAVAALAALYPLRFFRLPGAGEIDRRIEAANQLLHSPVLVQTDRPSGRESSFSQALWREHQKRMAGKLDNLGADLPRTRVPERDPWALRAVAALLLVTAFAFSFGPTGGRISDGFNAHGARDIVPPRIDAWVTPPSYTGKPPIFLTADANQAIPTFTVPEGSDVSLRVTGGSGEETLGYADKNGNSRAIDPAAPQAAAKPAASPATPSKVRQFTSKLTGDGTLTLTSGEDQLGRWAFAVVPDKPPQIRFVGEPKRAANGAFELNYQIDDDYGAATAKAVFALADPQAPNARPLYGAPEMPLTLPRRGGKSNAARTSKDLTEHVWAGSSIKLTLVATDDAGHTASSETKTLLMPERPFANPLARAVIEQRRLLALDANAKPRVLDLMDAITLRPEDTFDNMSHYLAIMSARTRLKMADSDDQLRSEVSYLWEIALGIEEGNLSAAEKRLRQAQQALQDAIKNGASDAEIEKAMKELREAMNQFLQEFAERAKQNPNAPQMQQNGQELRQSDIDRMMDQIENLAKSGDRDKAQQLLSQLQDMMNNLQAGRQQQGGQQDSEMRQQMDKLGEILRRQQEMMNDTFRMDQMQRGERQRGQNRDEQLGEGGQDEDRPGVGEDRDPLARQKPMTPQEFADALKQLQQGQGQLQSDLEQLKKGLEGMGMEPNEGFGEAGKSMGNAEQALGEGEGDAAVGHQGRALEALRKGAKDMMKQMQAMQGDQGGGEEGGRQQNADRDPLGRPRASQGPDFGDSVKVPDEIDVQRARQILEAIRKRLGNALSPDIERSYLERLLELK
ncbi:TIGR02302 family protein [Mesorhizobium sp. M7A.F.Ca.US.006.04.2.1]|uniref:TIGR02302 family protein n=3 Tax=Mesorhizobium TaxID=68287 RepID=UPI000FCA157A|nr:MULTISPECIES: TIGR02302 family protein [unclassified Mesorhizobium]RUX76190.1 TIGR02302 family protein [Mesorhizobium sp. M7A.F.Ca.US.005.03.1.1]RUY25568.1 TIGR02302 family protein [Mesorhizobium sp. M7A.F.Ca.US.001.04.2.1]RUY40553.1 TIGR02302 family protein [Mesorhizobium sp. M7A.F.Ca.US.001.04.1.1]RVA06658.1 TIGR02302 family protein [Mesorhizobium sp. M7A.F.Ca.US.002.01.1.1]RVA92866.1 TIGR02302 family protein [Mesorhizobium sp. M7A.F.Ca.US.006.04.2.1]